MKNPRKPTESTPAVMVKGKHEVTALLASSHKVSRVFLSAQVRDKAILQEVQHACRKRGVALETLAPADFHQRVGPDAQGVAAAIPAFAYTPEADFLADAATWDHGIIVVLDHLEDPRNLGAIIRTAEIGGIRAVLLPKNRAAEITEWAIRTSQGAVFFLPVVRVTNIVECLRKLKSSGFWAYGLSEKATSPYFSCTYPAKTVFAAGGEDQGLGRLVQSACDELISIPMHGKTPSLNVSISLGIVLFEALRQRATSPD